MYWGINNPLIFTLYLGYDINHPCDGDSLILLQYNRITFYYVNINGIASLPVAD